MEDRFFSHQRSFSFYFFVLRPSWRFLCVPEAPLKENRIHPFLSASWARLRDNTGPYLLCVAIGALLKEGLSSMNVLWGVVRDLQPRDECCKVALALPLMLQNL